MSDAAMPCPYCGHVIPDGGHGDLPECIDYLTAEIARLKTLVREAFEEGLGGLGIGHMRMRAEWWENSKARKALDGAA